MNVEMEISVFFPKSSVCALPTQPQEVPTSSLLPETKDTRCKKNGFPIFFGDKWSRSPYRVISRSFIAFDKQE